MSKSPIIVISTGATTTRKSAVVSKPVAVSSHKKDERFEDALVPEASQTSKGTEPSCHKDGKSRAALNHGVVIPEDDRFVPFALTIRAGDSVTWTNNDSDLHTVVSDDAVNSTGPTGINQELPPGTSLTLHFPKPGLWVYYCRIHAALDAFAQPVANDESTDNGKLPMSGVIAVLSA